MDFSKFKVAIATQFHQMQKHELYQTKVTRDELWDTYLLSFPEGTDLVYRERSEHDCSTCRAFVKTLGNLVTIIDNRLVSLWDVEIEEPGYQTVCNSLSALVKSQEVRDLFLHTEKCVGVDKNFEQMLTGSKTWEHFFVNIPTKFMEDNKQIGTTLSEARSKHDVMLRSLTEITPSSIATVLDLISQSGIYRGEEHKWALTAFEKLKLDFDKLKTENDKDLFVWSHLKETIDSVAKMRNTSIGTLLTDLSTNVDVENAVKSFESKVAPANYKRPKALVTKGMIEKAQAKIEELGLMSALSRRHARLDDITVNNILYVNRSARTKMASSVFDDLITSIPEKAKNYDKMESVSIDKFLSDILPRVESIEVLLENKHSKNLVNLIAPTDITAGSLFKWSNNFSWDYEGNMADSDIRQAVQARGGSVSGVFRFSHSWNNHIGKRNASLMDLHVFMPGSTVKAVNGTDTLPGTAHIGWNKRTHSSSGGIQDVDYTPPAAEGYVPVENITFPTLSKMPEGVYICKVHNWSLRQPTTSGFSAEIEVGGEIYCYDYPKPLGNKEWITVAEVTLKNGQFTIKHHLPEANTTKTLWGLTTQNFHKVNVVMHSPNFWDGQIGIGNRHTFFMIEGIERKEITRGFYNEFLKSELEPHRKAFELVASRMQVEKESNQLGGLGFSSTQRNSVVLRVKGAISRELKVTF